MKGNGNTLILRSRLGQCQFRFSHNRCDANGSITKIYEGTNATYFTYAPSLFVTQITPPAGTGQPWQFAYDGQHLKRKIVKGAAGASYYLWNDMNQLEERNSAGVLTARYTHGDPIFTGVGSVVEVQRTIGATTYFGNCTCTSGQTGNGGFADFTKTLAMYAAMVPLVEVCCELTCICTTYIKNREDQPKLMTSCVEKAMQKIFGITTNCNCW